MRKFRFHIASFSVLILLVAVCLAALRESNDIWDSSVFGITLSILVISILLAIHRPGSKKTFWLGFAVVGWIYLGLSLVPSIESRLVTSKALAYLDSKMPRSLLTGLAYFDYDNDGAVDMYIVNSQTHAFIQNKGAAMSKIIAPKVDPSSGSTRPSGSGWLFLLNSVGRWMTGTVRSSENFVRIGHSLFALVAAFAGGQVSLRLGLKSREASQESIVQK